MKLVKMQLFDAQRDAAVVCTTPAAGQTSQLCFGVSKFRRSRNDCSRAFSISYMFFFFFFFLCLCLVDCIQLQAIEKTG